MKDFQGTLRQAVRWASLSKDERVLRETGFLDDNGIITEQGRRIVADYQWANDADLRKAVTAMVKKTVAKEKKGEKDDE